MTDSIMYTPKVGTDSQEFSWKWFLLSAEGRICRKDFWLRFTVPYMVLSLIINVIDAQMGTLRLDGGMSTLSMIFILVTIYSSVVVYIKRWHDRDKSGWWCLLNLSSFLGLILMPIIGTLGLWLPLIFSLWALVECGFLRGTEGSNRFGPSRFASEQNLSEVFE